MCGISCVLLRKRMHTYNALNRNCVCFCFVFVVVVFFFFFFFGGGTSGSNKNLSIGLRRLAKHNCVRIMDRVNGYTNNTPLRSFRFISEFLHFVFYQLLIYAVGSSSLYIIMITCIIILDQCMLGPCMCVISTLISDRSSCQAPMIGKKS